jgi:hypothetical protein
MLQADLAEQLWFVQAVADVAISQFQHDFH